jgi:hypothetical protein
MNDGGYKVEINDATIPDGTYTVHLGPNSDATDPVCYSGWDPDEEGRGSNVTVAGGRFTCVTPILPSGTFAYHLVNTVTGAAHTTGLIQQVVAHDFRRRTMDLRRLLPRNWKTGYRRPDQEVFPQP